MICNDTNSDRLYIKLKGEINSAEGKMISLNRLFSAAEGIAEDMPVFLQSPEGQAAFDHAVRKLTSEQIIAPVGNKPATHGGLHLKYRINKEAAKKDSRLMSEIIKSIAPPATVDFYLKNPGLFLEDRAIIAPITGFLKQKSKDLLTVNERAYQLFGDEKFFKGDAPNRSRGEVILKRLGLDYASIGCEETIEPFFSFYRQDFFGCHVRQIYIIENRDTFWSFKKVLLDSPSRLRTDMLIYGEGKKILSSFRFVAEYDIDPEKDTFFYFGDLDAEGINIYCDLKDNYPRYRIFPFVEGYQALLEIGSKREPVKTPKRQKVNCGNIERFLQAFDPSGALQLKQLLEEGFYIPQEALSAAEIKERFGNAADD
jgi:hypothetical protein